jgi:hypothetical protein
VQELPVPSNPWQFERPAQGDDSGDRHCCRCEKIIPKAEAKYDTSERGYVCFACKNKRRREFLAKLVGVLSTGIAIAAYFIFRLIRAFNRKNQSSPDD